MSLIQKILLALACLLFVLTLYGMFTFNYIVVILLFLLHSLCLILFCYRCYQENETEQSASLLPQEIGLKMAELEEKDAALKEMQSTLTQKETDIELLQRDNERDMHRINELTQKVQSLTDELQAANEAAAEKENEPAVESVTASDLLPPLEDENAEPKEVDLVALAEKAKKDLAEDAKKSNLVVSVSCANESLMVKADANRLLVLFRNIIDNSIKYVNRPGSLVITLSTIADDIFIVLKDTGEGLSEDETKHIFELNYQGSNRISGNGLGLAQAKAIVDYYGGTVYARSTEGKGMGIYIQLPAK